MSYLGFYAIEVRIDDLTNAFNFYFILPNYSEKLCKLFTSTFLSKVSPTFLPENVLS